jgi:hypothetical protein
MLGMGGANCWERTVPVRKLSAAGLSSSRRAPRESRHPSLRHLPGEFVSSANRHVFAILIEGRPG